MLEKLANHFLRMKYLNYFYVTVATQAREALVSDENFSCLKKSVCHVFNCAIKTILTDAESHKEHDETKYSPIGRTTAELWMI